MHMHEENSSSLTMHLSLRHDCPKLEIHTMGFCDRIMSQTNPHWDNWTFGKWNSPPIDPKPILFWEVCPISKDGLPIYWICLEYDELWSWYCVPNTNGGSPIPPRISCVPPCLLILETTVVLSAEIMTQEWCMYFMAFFSTKPMAIISRILIWNWDWIFWPPTMKG